MITKQTKANQQLYADLFQKATYDLMVHDSEGNIIADPLNATDTAAMHVEHVDSGDWDNTEIYESGKYYTWDEAKKTYVLAEDQDRDPNKDYYKANDITSLNLYFSYLKSLTNIDKIYTMLPLDENIFEIDANSRTIKVPKDFAENGISVQGDEIAEILYFKIDRYFDAVDLSTKDVCIQWRAAGMNEDGTTRDGMSAPWLVDYKTYKDCVVFGWPISSAITKDAGEISFAVRFYEFNNLNKKIEYSLGTLTQKVTIKPSLDFNIEEALKDIAEGTHNSPLIVDDNNALIKDRTKDSLIEDGSFEADVPEFIRNLYLDYDNDPMAAESTARPDPYDESIMNIEGWLAKDTSTPEQFRRLPVTAKVYATGGGRITYSWRKLDIDDSHAIAFAENPKFIFEPFTGNAPEEGIIYYTKVDVNTYERHTGDCFDRTDVENYPAGGIYERYSSAVIDSVGQYIVTVTNRVYNSTKQIRSYRLLVKRPVKIYRGNAAIGEANNFNNDLPPRGYLKVDDNGNHSNDYKLTLTTDVDVSDKAHSVLTYQWQKRINPEDNWISLEGETGKDLTIVGAVEGGSNSGDGYYQVIVYNNLNNEQESCESGTTRVTHMPCQPEVLIATPEEKFEYSLANLRDVGGLRVTARIPTGANENRTQEDTVTFQWYKYQESTGDVQNDRAAADIGEYTINGDIALTEESVDGYSYMPTETGYYFCHVTNYYNGQANSRNSVFFRII